MGAGQRAEQREVAEQVEQLVPRRLVLEAERAVEPALPVAHERTLRRRASDQTLGRYRGDVGEM